MLHRAVYRVEHEKPRANKVHEPTAAASLVADPWERASLEGSLACPALSEAAKSTRQKLGGGDHCDARQPEIGPGGVQPVFDSRIRVVDIVSEV